METKDFGPLFVTKAKAPRRRVWWAKSRMTEPPYRIGRGLGVNVSRDLAYVVGVWGLRRSFESHDKALKSILGFKETDEIPEEIRTWVGPGEEDLYQVIPLERSMMEPTNELPD